MTNTYSLKCRKCNRNSVNSYHLICNVCYTKIILEFDKQYEILKKIINSKPLNSIIDMDIEEIQYLQISIIRDNNLNRQSIVGEEQILKERERIRKNNLLNLKLINK